MRKIKLSNIILTLVVLSLITILISCALKHDFNSNSNDKNTTVALDEDFNAHIKDTELTAPSDILKTSDKDNYCSFLYLTFGNKTTVSKAEKELVSKLKDNVIDQEKVIEETTEKTREFTYRGNTVTLNYDCSVNYVFAGIKLNTYKYQQSKEYDAPTTQTVSFYDNGEIYQICGAGLLGRVDNKNINNDAEMRIILEREFSDTLDFSVYDDFQVTDLTEYMSDKIMSKTYTWKIKDICGASVYGETSVKLDYDTGYVDMIINGAGCLKAKGYESALSEKEVDTIAENTLKSKIKELGFEVDEFHGDTYDQKWISKNVTVYENKLTFVYYTYATVKINCDGVEKYVSEYFTVLVQINDEVSFKNRD